MASTAPLRSSLLWLPTELLEVIVYHAVWTPWPQHDIHERSAILRVCKRFHTLARRALYRNVVLSTLQGFHSFFMVDTEDWEAANMATLGQSGFNIPSGNINGQHWREQSDAFSRRIDDWSRVGFGVWIRLTRKLILRYIRCAA